MRMRRRKRPVLMRPLARCTCVMHHEERQVKDHQRLDRGAGQDAWGRGVAYCLQLSPTAAAAACSAVCPAGGARIATPTSSPSPASSSRVCSGGRGPIALLPAPVSAITLTSLPSATTQYCRRGASSLPSGTQADLNRLRHQSVIRARRLLCMWNRTSIGAIKI
jgi:hypothetical protein